MTFVASNNGILFPHSSWDQNLYLGPCQGICRVRVPLWALPALAGCPCWVRAQAALSLQFITLRPSQDGSIEPGVTMHHVIQGKWRQEDQKEIQILSQNK